MALFGQRKPKQFNFKPVYIQEDKENKTGFSEKMHKQWNRIPHSQLLIDGKRKTIRSVGLIGVLIYLAVKLYEYITQSI